MPAAKPRMMSIRYMENPTMAKSFFPRTKKATTITTSKVLTNEMLNVLPRMRREV